MKRCMDYSQFTSISMLTGRMRCHSSFNGVATSFVVTDVPARLGGRGEHPTPAALLAAALASCMLSMLAYTGTQKGFDTSGISARACCHEDSHGISAFELLFSVPMNTSPRVRFFMESAVRSCPVARAMHPDIPKNITWVYADDADTH